MAKVAPRTRKLKVGGRPRAHCRALGDSLPLRTTQRCAVYLHHPSEDLAIAYRASTRKYRRSLDKLPEDQAERSTSKSAMSRRFVALSQKQITAWLSAPLSDLDVRVLVIHSIVLLNTALIWRV